MLSLSSKKRLTLRLNLKTKASTNLSCTMRQSKPGTSFEVSCVLAGVSISLKFSSASQISSKKLTTVILTGDVDTSMHFVRLLKMVERLQKVSKHLKSSLTLPKKKAIVISRKQFSETGFICTEVIKELLETSRKKQKLVTISLDSKLYTQSKLSNRVLLLEEIVQLTKNF